MIHENDTNDAISDPGISDFELINELKLLTITKNKHKEFEYNRVEIWNIYMQNQLFKSIVFRLKKLICETIGKDNFDYICAVPPCGIPLSSCLSLAMEKPLIIPSHQELRLFRSESFYNEEKIEHNKRILLVDIIINYGNSARNTKDNLSSIKGKFIGLAVVLFNDTLNKNMVDCFKIDEQDKIYYLFKVSELTTTG